MFNVGLGGSKVVILVYLVSQVVRCAQMALLVLLALKDSPFYLEFRDVL